MKIFKCVTLSRNTNSFGLRGAILVARDGEAWEIASGSLGCPTVGEDYGVPQPTAAYFARDDRQYLDQDDVTAGTWSRRGWELPKRLPNAPSAACAEVWPAEVVK